MHGWYDNEHVDAALDAARESGKPLLIDFWSATCLGCAKLLKRTYTDPAVRAFLRDNVVALKFETARTPDQFRRLNGRTVHMWHPHLVVTDHRLSESRRIVGYLTPDSLLGHLHIAIGLLALYRKNYQGARDRFAAGAGGQAPQEVTAEALYWLGVAEYRLRGLDALKSVWSELAQRFPSSDWTVRADCLDIVIPDGGFDPYDLETITVTRAAPALASPDR